ncbi:MAG: hypothetical protein LBV27_04600, partial [Oscillospiraceae bacterium]|nr:hypothetical protein [Oscillospiraceae bacterium]
IYDYKCPEAIRKVALDQSKVMINKQRMSMDVKDAKAYGVDPADFDNIMFFWGIQCYSAREVIENSKKVVTPTNWMNERFNAFSENYALCDLAHIPTDDDPDFTAMTKVNLYTYKTPDYILSSAQDFRKGKQGYQQQPWGAFMGGRARVFTNHMGTSEYAERPNFLAGNAYLPRIAQHENVLLAVYRVPIWYIQYFETHAYFPRHEFDEVVEKDGWVFGRRHKAYIALKSMNPADWKPKDPNMFKAVYEAAWQEYYDKADDYIYHCNGHANVWVTEMGSEAQSGSFEQFMAGFKGAGITGDTFTCAYQSPSLGEVGFGWNEDLTVNGTVIPLGDYDRYDNPFCKAAFDSRERRIQVAGQDYVIDHNI